MATKPKKIKILGTLGVPYTHADRVIPLNSSGSVEMRIFTTSDGYDAVVTGTGAIPSYPENDRPYESIVLKITRLRIEKGVTSIGDYFMYKAFNLKHLTFEDSTTINHLGAYAFARTQISGEYAFPRLTDTAVDKVFQGCARLEGVTFSASVKEITGFAFRNCFALRYVHGLSGLTSISGHMAFLNCPTLEELDLTPGNVTLGNGTFARTPSTAKCADGTLLHKAKWASEGVYCFLQNAWTSEQITALNNVTGESSKLPIPAYDGQFNDGYDSYQIHWAIIPWTENDSTYLFLQRVYAYGAGCGFFALYHAYNSRHADAPFHSFYDFVEHIIKERKITVSEELNEVLTADEYSQKLINENNMISYETGSKITALDLLHDLKNYEYGEIGTAFWGYLQTLGWSADLIYTAENDGPVVKQTIIDNLSARKPVLMSFFSGTDGSDASEQYPGYYHDGHTVAILGYDATTDKFLVVDSTNYLPTKCYAPAYWVKFQEMITPIGAARIVTFDFEKDIHNKLDEMVDREYVNNAIANALASQLPSHIKLKDTVTGAQYRLYVENGELKMEVAQ